MKLNIEELDMILNLLDNAIRELNGVKEKGRLNELQLEEYKTMRNKIRNYMNSKHLKLGLEITHN